MSCFAMLCHQAHPCRTRRACEAVWHACNAPKHPPAENAPTTFTCRDCGAHWTWNARRLTTANP